MLKNSVVGLFDGVSRITESVGKGLAEATFDEQFQEERREREKQAPSHALTGAQESIIATTTTHQTRKRKRRKKNKKKKENKRKKRKQKEEKKTKGRKENKSK